MLSNIYVIIINNQNATREQQSIVESEPAWASSSYNNATKTSQSYKFSRPASNSKVSNFFALVEDKKCNLQ